MLNNTKYSIVLALILSVLIHGFILIYSYDGAVGEKSAASPVVMIQLEIVNSSKKNILVSPTEIGTNENLIANTVTGENKKHQEIKSFDVASEQAEITELPVQMAYVAEDLDEVNDQVNVAGNVNQLLSLVYQEINRKKHYPYRAKRQRREGLVKLSFVLHPDGKVTDISVVESSQFSVLDRAAQKAVEDISPFMLAADYLSYQQAFNVDVDFRLGKI